MTTAEQTTAIRRADSTEMLRYRMVRDIDPSSTSLTFTFTDSSGNAHSAAGEWHIYDDTAEEQECIGWYARVNVGPVGAITLAAGSYSVVLSVTDGPETAKYCLGNLLVVAAS